MQQETQQRSEAEIESLRVQLRTVLAGYVEEGYLQARERLVLLARLALGDGRWQTLDEVADALGVKRERARQVQNRAMYKLRKRPACAALLSRYFTLAPPPHARHRQPGWLTKERTLEPISSRCTNDQEQRS